ncbi:MAG: helix-turn-helix domain-containing protein [Pseudomonadota bacterium]
MLALDASARFGGIAVLLLLAVLGWQHRRTWSSAPYLILACLSVAALFVGFAPAEFQPPRPWFSIVRFADIPHLVFVWLFALSLYERDFHLKSWHILVGVLYSAPILWPRLAFEGIAPPPPSWLVPLGVISSIALIGHLVYATLVGRSDDLIEQRRSSRAYFVIVLMVVTVAAALADFLPREGSFDRRTAKVLAILPAILFGGIWMLRLSPQGMRFERVALHANSLSSRDEALLAKLRHQMIEVEAFQDPSLSIAALAATLGVSQHRLRHLINGHLGFANFSSFVNRLRIDAVCRALEDPAERETPVLTMALDNGFGSLSSFNKAFKDNTGITPTEYRAKIGSDDPPTRIPSAF